MTKTENSKRAFKGCLIQTFFELKKLSEMKNEFKRCQQGFFGRN